MVDISLLRSLVAFATRTEGCTFYRSFYGVSDDVSHLDISSWEEFRSLPFLTRERIATTPMSDRTFSPLSEVELISASSGTSGKPPVFIPRTFAGPVAEKPAAPFHDFKGATLSCGLRPAPHETELALQALGGDTRVITMDPKHIPASLALTRAGEVRTIMGMSFLILATLDDMVRAGFADDVRLIDTSGESLTASEFGRITRAFPHARVMSTYASRETGATAYTEPSREYSSYVFRSCEHAHLEIIHSDTGVLLDPAPGVEGELIITVLTPEKPVFPLIRYRIGDIVRVVDVATDGTFSFLVRGRAEMEFLKVPGGLLRVDELMRVVSLFSDVVTDRFVMHCYEKETPKGVMKQLVLHVESPGNQNLEALALVIAHELHLGPTFTYSDGVSKGLYLPLVCMALKDVRLGKQKRIIRHW